ncbi:PD-(D/E)XK nuclease family protein [Patescibacteria group bacterium]|nr:PD-(D/E)XK nuclease family protein [Patescibacteria group bacterium]
MNDYSKVYSHSKLDLFKKCKKGFYFNYLDPVIAPIKKQFCKPRDYKTKGSAVHGAITLFYYLPKKKRNFEGLKKCLKEAWFSELDIYRQAPLGLLGGFRDIEHEREVYGDALRQLQNFLEIEEDMKPSLFYNPVKTIRQSFEDYERMIQPLKKKLFISGKFDRIDELENGNLRIVDFKTGKSKNGIEQLELYKLLAEMNFGKRVDEVSYYYLNDGKIKSYDVANVDIKDIKNKILDKIDVIQKNKVFNTTRTRLCDHCDFKEICPAHGGSYVQML